MNLAKTDAKKMTLSPNTKYWLTSEHYNYKIKPLNNQRCTHTHKQTKARQS